MPRRLVPEFLGTAWLVAMLASAPLALAQGEINSTIGRSLGHGADAAVTIFVAKRILTMERRQPERHRGRGRRQAHRGGGLRSTRSRPRSATSPTRSTRRSSPRS